MTNIPPESSPHTRNAHITQQSKTPIPRFLTVTYTQRPARARQRRILRVSDCAALRLEYADRLCFWGGRGRLLIDSRADFAVYGNRRAPLLLIKPDCSASAGERTLTLFKEQLCCLCFESASGAKLILRRDEQLLLYHKLLKLHE